MKRKIIVGAIQIGSFIGFVYLFGFHWTPWFSCRPVTALDLQKYGLQSVPADARCFNISDGKVVFHAYSTVSVRFALLSLVVIILWGIVSYTYFRYGDSPLVRLLPQLRRVAMQQDKQWQ